jgi:hypothetical protein
MRSQTLILFAAAFVAVSGAPQAMAQSCNAMHTDVGNWFQTQPNDRWTYGISLNADTAGTDGPYIGYSEGVAGHSPLKTLLPHLKAELFLSSLNKPHMTSTFSLAPLKPVQAQFNSW